MKLIPLKIFQKLCSNVVIIHILVSIMSITSMYYVYYMYVNILLVFRQRQFETPGFYLGTREHHQVVCASMNININ